MLTKRVKAGATDVSVAIFIFDSTDGTPETGVVFNSAGIDIEYRREGAVTTDITEATLATLDAAHSDGGFLHIGNGYYRVDLPDAAVATGVNGVLVHGTVTGMIVIGCYVELMAEDPYTAGKSDLPTYQNVIAKDATDQTLYITATDRITGGPKTGLVFNTSGLSASYVRALGSRVALTLATQTVTGAHSDGGFVEIDATNMPGLYRLDLPDAVIATGVNEARVQLKGTDLDFSPVKIDLTAYDPNAAGASTAEIADAVWDEANADHVTAGTTGKTITDVLVDTGTTLDGKLPAALVGGRIDASVGAMAANVLTDTAINADAITAAKVAADVGTEIGTAVWATTTRQLTATQTFALTGNITGNLSGSVGSVTGAVGSVTGAVGSVTGAVGSVTAGVTLAADAVTAAALAADAGTELAAAVLAAATTTPIAANVEQINTVPIVGDGSGTPYNV